jgi:6,7-dimethyl-8-ribityllumazine synthase
MSSSSNPPTTGLFAQHRIAYVSANWHRDIVDRARQSAVEHLERHGAMVECFEVPGAFEIPLHVKMIAGSGHYDAVIACALVVNGGIYQHEFVASAVVDGLMRIQLDSDVPVFSAVLTPRDFHEHDEHRQFFSDHFAKKGKEVADACLATLERRREIRRT